MFNVHTALRGIDVPSDVGYDGFIHGSSNNSTL